MHRDLAQALATARTSHALAASKLEARTMHGAYQQAVLAAQELARRPIQATTGMRANVQPCMHLSRGIAMHDQRFRIAIQHRLDLMQAVR